MKVKTKQSKTKKLNQTNWYYLLQQSGSSSRPDKFFKSYIHYLFTFHQQKVHKKLHYVKYFLIHLGHSFCSQNIKLFIILLPLQFFPFKVEVEKQNNYDIMMSWHDFEFERQSWRRVTYLRKEYFWPYLETSKVTDN